MSEQDDEFQKVPIPLYLRICHVQVEMDGTMRCECCNSQGRGLFCVYQVKVAISVYETNGVEFEGYNYHDIAVHHLSGYMHLTYRASTPKIIRDTYHHLASNAIRGTNIHTHIPKSMSIEEGEVVLPAKDHLKNC